jgi:hypothetical protein
MKRLAIDRLDIDLRGVPPATAEAAVRLIGPALARALSGRHVFATPGASIDAGRVTVGTAPNANALATRVAQQIAVKTSESRS